MASSPSSDSILQFAPLHSLVDAGFWRRFSNLKLDTFKIDESPISITGFYAPCSNIGVPNYLTLLAESLPPESNEVSSDLQLSAGNRNKCPVPGTMINTNTLESFVALDKKCLLNIEAKKIYDDIKSGKVEEDCSLLSRFLLISFADLKKWEFKYWFAFPALVLDPAATLINIQPASQMLSPEETESLSAACNEWRNSSLTTGMPFFLVCISSTSHVIVRSLKDWINCQGDDQKLLFGFYDPCHAPNNPGWPLRNYLAFICLRWKLKKVTFLCYREKHGSADMQSSLIGEALVTIPQEWRDPQCIPKNVGWETNEKGKLRSRNISLAESMDPEREDITDMAFPNQDSRKFLKTYKQNKFVTQTPVTEEQQMVLDNIWNMSTSPQDNKQKLSILYTLVNIFQDTKKKFTHYCLFNGMEAGIYSSWEELIPKIDEIEKNPRIGIPKYKGYTSYKDAKEAIEKQYGKDYVISESIKQILDITSGKYIKDRQMGEADIDLRPKVSYKDKAISEIRKGKMVELGPIPGPIPYKTIQYEHPQSPTDFTDNYIKEINHLNIKDQDVTKYKMIFHILARCSTTEIKGMKINWKVVRNKIIPCSNKSEDCKNYALNCKCNIISSTPLVQINLPQYKYIIQDQIILDPITLLKYGFIEKLYIGEWTMTELPEPLSSITDYFTEILGTELCVEITSTPPHFGKNILDPTRHIMKIKAQNFDENYQNWENTTERQIIPSQEINQITYENYRAYMIGNNMFWTEIDEKEFKLYAESPIMKIYISNKFEEFGYKLRPFDIYHPKTHMVNNFKRQMLLKVGEQTSQTTEDNEDEEIQL